MKETSRAWAPKPVLVVSGWLCAFVFLGLSVGAVFSGDRIGAFLLSFAALVTLAWALHGSVVRPRLSANHQGVVIHALRGTQLLRWSEVSFVVKKVRRLGRDSFSLELEQGERLIIFGRFELGHDPQDVFDSLVDLSGRG